MSAFGTRILWSWIPTSLSLREFDEPAFSRKDDYSASGATVDDARMGTASREQIEFTALVID